MGNKNMGSQDNNNAGQTGTHRQSEQQPQQARDRDNNTGDKQGGNAQQDKSGQNQTGSQNDRR